VSTRLLPVADAALLHPATTRSRRLRAALSVASLLLLGAAIVLAARSPSQAAAGAAGGGASTEIVLDVSGSVDSSSRAAGAALTRLARGGGRAGLILFSDTAQETLPPTTPVAQLLPFARAFAPAKRSTARPYPPQFDSNPWRPSFSGGTRISAGLAAARAALRRDRGHGSVLLISDLGNPVTDAGATKRQLIALDRAGIDVKILPLPNALSADLRWFRRLEGPARFEHPLPARQPRRPATEAFGFPLALAGAATLLALVLAADQLAGRSLRWGAIR
jgi:hypothetical protein